MKARFVSERLRLRLDDLELADLQRGEALTVSISWSAGGWSVRLDPLASQTVGVGGDLSIGLATVLPELLAASEGIELQYQGLKISIQKDFLPEH